MEQNILANEEVLLDVLCFDFDIMHPHAYVTDVFLANERAYPEVKGTDGWHRIQDCIWSVPHDTYRTPLCLLYPPHIIAAGSILFGLCLAEGPTSRMIASRITTDEDGDLPWRRVLSITENDYPATASERAKENSGPMTNRLSRCYNSFRAVLLHPNSGDRSTL